MSVSVHIDDLNRRAIADIARGSLSPNCSEFALNFLNVPEHVRGRKAFREDIIEREHQRQSGERRGRCQTLFVPKESFLLPVSRTGIALRLTTPLPGETGKAGV